MATTCRLFNASHRWTGLSVSQVPLSSARKAFSVEGCNAGPLRLNLRRSMAAKASSDAPVEVAVTATEKPPLVLKAPPGVGAFRIGPGQTLDVATASVQVVLRLGSSAFTLSNVNQYKRPAQPIILYEFEGCPFCRKVREVVSILDLDVLYYPCPQGGPTFRPKAVEMSGKKQFPFLVDPNTGRQMLESDDIIKYLVTEYGDGKVPLLLNLGAFTTITAGFGMLPRANRGSRYRASKLPEEPVELWGYEASPFVKLVREVLNELELPHVLHTCARGSAKRQALADKWGVPFQVPYFEDPNTGSALFESGQIIAYLEETYAAPASS